MVLKMMTFEGIIWRSKVQINPSLSAVLGSTLTISVPALNCSSLFTCLTPLPSRLSPFLHPPQTAWVFSFALLFFSAGNAVRKWTIFPASTSHCLNPESHCPWFLTMTKLPSPNFLDPPSSTQLTPVLDPLLCFFSRDPFVNPSSFCHPHQMFSVKVTDWFCKWQLCVS